MAVAAAYVYDRAHQYVPSSGIHAALSDVAFDLQAGEALHARDHGELVDLIGNVPRPKQPGVSLKREDRLNAEARHIVDILRGALPHLSRTITQHDKTAEREMRELTRLLGVFDRLERRT